MPRPLLIALIAFVATANLYGQEAKKPSPAVTRILDEAVRAVKRNRVEFDKANQKPLGEARKALEELSTKLIKDGKADEAGAVLKQVGTLEADVMRMASAPAPMAGGGGVVPQKPLLERLAGKWTHPTMESVRVLKGDGSFEQYNGGKVSMRGTWSKVGDNCVEISRENGSRITVWLIDDRTVAVQFFSATGGLDGGGAVWYRQ